MENFNTVWDTLSSLNTIPSDVLEEIDILKGASPDFINFVAELESQTDYDTRAKKAKAYIDSNKGLKEINYENLGYYLSNYKAAPLDFWRKLYVLERSIKPRFGNKYTWLNRLKMFYNTYIRESAIANKATYKGKKLYFIKGNKNNPANHDKLVYGQGKWGADFYFYDDTIDGNNYDKMVKVEMKHGNADLETEITRYKNNKFLYNAKYLLLAMSDGSYYMVNYNVEPAEVTKLSITCPDVFKL